MTSKNAKQLISAAASLEKAAAALEAANTEVKSAQAQAKQAKVAADKATTQSKMASADDKQREVRIGQLAKVAADTLLDAGLLSSREQADIFASNIRNPEVALEKIATVAKHVQVPRLGNVVVDDHRTTKVASADDVWANHIQKARAQLGQG